MQSKAEFGYLTCHIFNRSSNMCQSICGRFVQLPWVFQLIIPFIVLVTIGLIVASEVEEVVCQLCNTF
jgi:hypothetical protein